MKTDFTVSVLAKAMNLRLQKHSAIASNLANADTPGFRPRSVSFEESLQQAVERRDTRQLGGLQARIEITDDGVPRLDGNSVSVDKQMAEMTENSTVYSATAEFLRRKLGMIKRVIE
ncbi:MAG: flagellar basal body rod protein FlgB [Bradymonadales bacterium]|nr:MAG: flagellar basal body rod protein FlgB [Bradymonadales bacterium]